MIVFLGRALRDLTVDIHKRAWREEVRFWVHRVVGSVPHLAASTWPSVFNRIIFEYIPSG